MKSETVNVLDDLTARFLTGFGGILNGLGEFVINTVDQLPGTIDAISKSINTAVNEGNDRVSMFCQFNFITMHVLMDIIFLHVYNTIINIAILLIRRELILYFQNIILL